MSQYCIIRICQRAINIINCAQEGASLIAEEWAVKEKTPIFHAYIPGNLVTMDLEKAFDSLDHDFLSCALKKFGFGDDQQSAIK